MAIMNRFQSFGLDIANHCLWHGKDRVHLAPKAFDVLCYLVERAGRLVTTNEMLEALWPKTYINPEGLRRYIQQIRQVLGDHPENPVFIETVPKRGYQFIAPVTADSIAEPSGVRAETAKKLVGRNSARDELDRSLDKAAQGERQVVFITGEAGVGKTALVDDFQCRAAASLLGLRIARGQSVEGFGGKEPYYPVLEALGGMCRLMPEEVVRALAAQAPTWLVQFPALVTPEHREMLQREILGVTRDRMLREISEALETITSHNPLLLVLEDLQWADASTVDLISVLARRRSRARLMVIGTYRPVDLVLCEHPLRALKQDLLVHHLCRRIALEPLRESDVGDYLAEESGGAALPAGLSGWLYRRSEGNPLFMVALLEDMIQRGFILREEEQWIFNLPGEEIDLDVPETLHQMIAAQIERLSFEEQRVLEAASLESLGHPRFAVTSRAAAVDMEPGVFEAMCETLSRRYHILRPAGSQELSDGSESACYEFVHTLYRNVCYQRIPPRLRATLYWRIGEEARVGQPRGSALIATKPRLRLGR